MGMQTSSYSRGLAKNIKMDIPPTPIKEKDVEKGFRKGMKEKLTSEMNKKMKINIHDKKRCKKCGFLYWRKHKC